MSANIATRLAAYYVDNFRRLPWRAGPGETPPDPYRVWLSEIMLQQTTVAAVIPRFERFLARWPTIRDLAAASDDEVLEEWAGLGYYARARNLAACARSVAALGSFPTSEAELRELPGIGAYTAAAIAAIAFGRRAVVVDTNVARVMARLYGLEQADPSRIRALTASHTPETACGDFAQAMMDLGAEVCRPRAPLCTVCPLASICAAAKSGDPERFPRPKPRKIKPTRYGVALWIEQEDKVRLVRRPPEGLLGGMAALPGTEWTADQPPQPHPLARISHAFTHFRLELALVEADTWPGDGWWQPLATLGDVGLPTLYRRLVERVLADRESRLAA